jgi:hypothetical protein
VRRPLRCAASSRSLYCPLFSAKNSATRSSSCTSRRSIRCGGAGGQVWPGRSQGEAALPPACQYCGRRGQLGLLHRPEHGVPTLSGRRRPASLILSQIRPLDTVVVHAAPPLVQEARTSVQHVQAASSGAYRDQPAKFNFEPRRLMLLPRAPTVASLPQRQARSRAWAAREPVQLS